MSASFYTQFVYFYRHRYLNNYYKFGPIFYRYELSDRGSLNQKELTVVPDVYSQNQQLQEQLAYVTKERDRYKDIALYAFQSS